MGEGHLSDQKLIKKKSILVEELHQLLLQDVTSGLLELQLCRMEHIFKKTWLHPAEGDKELLLPHHILSFSCTFTVSFQYFIQGLQCLTNYLYILQLNIKSHKVFMYVRHP